MKTINSRHLLPLAAIALIAAACDPFPAAPGGDPAIVRITATDQDWTGHSVTVENTGAPGTIVMDQAYPLDRIFIQFNKPMDGKTLQKYPNYDANGNKIDPATLPAADQATGVCTKPTNLTSNFPANTTFCYYPSSVTDGGQLVVGAVTDADGNRAAWINADTVYTITGTVNDYQGKALAIDVSVSLSTTPFTTTTDTLVNPALGRSYSYGLYVDWFPKAGDTGYNVSIAPDDGTGTPPTAASNTWTTKVVATTACTQSLYPTSPPTTLGATVCQTSYGELDPETDYWVRVQAAGATTWNVSDGPQTTRIPMTPTLTNFSDPLVTPPVISQNAVQVTWGRYLGTAVANGTAGTFPPPATALPPPDPAFTATELADYLASAPANDRTVVVVERITSTFDSAGSPVMPADTDPGWTNISATMVRVDDVVTNDGYAADWPTITFPTHFTFLSRTGVDPTAVSGTGYWYRVRPAYVSGKVLVGAPVYKKSN